MPRIEPTESSQARQSANSSLIFSLSFFLIALENSPISSTSQLNVLAIPLFESFSKYIFLISFWYLFRSIDKDSLTLVGFERRFVDRLSDVV